MSAKYIIKAEDKTKKGVSSARKNLKGLGKNLDQTSKAGIKGFGGMSQMLMGKAGLVFGVALLTKKTMDFGKQSVKVWRENEQVVKRYETAVNSSNSSLGEMNDFVDALSKKTLTSQTEIQNLTARMINLGRTDQETQRILETSVGIANATGENLSSVARQVNQTFSGIAGSLSRELVPELRNLTQEQLKSGEAIDILEEKFGDFSGLMEDTSGQTLKNFNDAMDTLQQNMGEWLSNSFDPFIEWMGKVAEKANEIMDDWNEQQTVQEVSYSLDPYVEMGGQRERENIREATLNKTAEELALQIEAIEQMKIINRNELDERKKERQDERLNYLLTMTTSALENLDTRLERQRERSETQTNDAFIRQMEESLRYEQERNQILQETKDQNGDKSDEQLALLEANKIDSQNFDNESLIRLVELGRIDLAQQIIEAQNFQPENKETNNKLQQLIDVGKEAKENSIRQKEIMEDMGKEEVDNEVIRAWANEGLGTREAGITDKQINMLLQSNDEMANQIGQYFLDQQYGDKTSEVDTGILDFIKDSPFGDFLEMLGEAVSSLGAVVQLLNWQETIISGIMDVIAPMINQVLTPLVGVLKFFGNVIGEVLLPVFDALNQILLPLLGLFANLYDRILKPIFSLLSSLIDAVLTPLFSILGVVLSLFNVLIPILNVLFLPLMGLIKIIEFLLLPLQALAVITDVVGQALAQAYNKLLLPVINKLAEGFVWLYNTMIDVFGGMLSAIVNMIRSVIGAINRIPFVNVSRPDRYNPDDNKIGFQGFDEVNIGGSSTDGTTMDDFYTAGGYDDGFSTGSGAGGSGGTAAQYTGGKDITINVEVNTGVLTGDNGFDELALRLRDSIDRQVSLGY